MSVAPMAILLCVLDLHHATWLLLTRCWWASVIDRGMAFYWGEPAAAYVSRALSAQHPTRVRSTTHCTQRDPNHL